MQVLSAVTLTRKTTMLQVFVLFAMALVHGLASAGTLGDRVVKASPIDEVVAQYPAMMSQGIRDGLAQSGRVDPLLAETISGVVGRAFSAADIRAQVVRDLDREMNEGQLQSVLEWYETPLAKKISRAEIQASSPSAWKEIETKSAALTQKYQGTERDRMFARFDKASRATESAVDTSIALQLSLASAMTAFRGGNGPSFEQMKQQIESQRFMLRGAVEQQVYAGYLYTYEQLSASELGLYLDFLESSAGSEFTRVVTNSVQQAILEPVETVGNQMIRLLNPN